jgi:hypothetical protein
MQYILSAILPVPPVGTPAEIAETAIDFFSLWVARAGGFVAFFGAIKFALSIKSEDAKEMAQSILTMISGFMVIAAVTSLDIFTVAGGAGIDAEFNAIMTFIGQWAGFLGSAVLLVGAIMFGFAIRDENAGAKITGVKTFAAGAMVLALAVSLPLFV